MPDIIAHARTYFLRQIQLAFGTNTDRADQIREFVKHRLSLIAKYQATLLGIALLLGLSSPARAEFTITNTIKIENHPTIVYNSVQGEYLAAWLSAPSGGAPDVIVQRISKTGTLLGTPTTVLIPGALALATGRPALAYSPASNRYVIAINRYYGPTADKNLLHVGTLNGTTLAQTEAYSLFVDSEFHDPSANFNPGAIRLTYNPVTEEFLVSYQRTIVVDDVSGTKHNFISTQRYQVGTGQVGSELNPIDYGLKDIFSHDVAVGSYILQWSPPNPPVLGSRYLIAYSGGGLAEMGVSLLDATGEFHLNIPFSSGVGGASQYPAIASGNLPGMGRAYWLLVWSDSNNLCKENGHAFVVACGATPGWSGIWGTYLDPWRTSYGPGPDNAVFPISKIASHVESTTPTIAFNDPANLFYVAWREYPGENPLNNESRSHIRGNSVDYFVTSEPSPMPYDNIVISPVTGTCPPAPAGCLSQQDPSYPAIATDNVDSALVVWQLHHPPNPPDLDVKGSLLDPTMVPEPEQALLLASSLALLFLLSLQRRRHPTC